MNLLTVGNTTVSVSPEVAGVLGIGVAGALIVTAFGVCMFLKIRRAQKRMGW